MIERINTTARYSDATIFNGIVHAVEVPPSEVGTVADQAQALMQSLERTLKAAGSGLGHMLMATIYLVDMNDYDAFNAVWEAWVPIGTAPARACVQVPALAHPGWRVEVAVMAARKD
ncbi:RidA family protein [Uliginosibacterium sp. sgz301328]|uniref:RidA family protein n=1 Tax=Uliginosibacterium sp. sgz301328 TaxID=3243764 RepID=UPI00359D6A71